MRAPILISLLVLCACGANFKPETLVDGLRVLSITANPPEVAPGETASLDILHFDPTRPLSETTVVWVGCEPDPIDFNRSACNDTTALLQPTAFATFPPGVRLLGFGTHASYASAGTLFDGVDAGDPVRTNGTSGPALAVVIGEKINPTADDAELRDLFGRIERQELQTVFAITRVTVSEKEKKNHNPGLAPLRFDGQPLVPNAKLLVKPGQRVKVTPQAVEGSAETYEVVLPGGTESRSESLVVAWYSSSGRWDRARVDLAMDPTTTFIAPGAAENPDDPVPEKRTGALFTVLRDDRGGKAFATTPFFVCDDAPTPVVREVKAPTNPGDPITVRGENASSIVDVVIGGVALTRGAYSAGIDAFLGEVPPLPAGTYPVQVRARNCQTVETGLTWNQP